MSTDDLPREALSCPLCRAAAGRPCRTISEPARPIAFLHLERIQAYYRSLR